MADSFEKMTAEGKCNNELFSSRNSKKRSENG